MRLITKILSTIAAACLMLMTFSAAAQYRGGAGDGITLASSLNSLPLGISIFRGGKDDGFILAAPVNSLALGTSIFRGGNGDGIVLSNSPNSLPLGLNIFHGGKDDGISLAASLNSLPLGLNIFHGGNDDGYVVAAPANAQNLGLNFYKGGVNDGWAVAVVDNIALPVTLVSFTASWQQKDVLTKWQTSVESNTDHFEVERSTDGNHFITVGQVAAAGNSSSMLNYTFRDIGVNNNYPVPPQKLYYRLKTVDRDGKLSYSAVVLLTNDQTTATVYTLFPNPANQQLIIESGGIYRPYSITLFSGGMQLLLQNKNAGQKEMVNLSRFPSGAYYVLITDTKDKTTQTFKILIQH